MAIEHPIDERFGSTVWEGELLHELIIGLDISGTFLHDVIPEYVTRVIRHFHSQMFSLFHPRQFIPA